MNGQVSYLLSGEITDFLFMSTDLSFGSSFTSAFSSGSLLNEKLKEDDLPVVCLPRDLPRSPPGLYQKSLSLVLASSLVLISYYSSSSS